MGLRPTTDLDQLKADLDEHGYCIVADAHPKRSPLRARITEQAAAERVRAPTTTIAEAEGFTTSTSGYTN